MTLIKTSLLNGIAVIVKIISVLVLNKILAIYVGPAGYAIIGQFQNAVSLLISIAGGLVSSGVVKTTAQNFDNEAKQHQIWQTAIRLSLFLSLLASLILLFNREWLSRWLLHRSDMSNIFIFLALALPAMTANNLLLAITNGKKEVKIYIIANITGSFVSMIVVGLLTYNFGLFGALLAFTINPAIVLLTIATFITRCSWFRPRFLWGKIDKSAAHNLSGFALMGFTSALLVPATFMIIRNYLVDHLGLIEAGYWQASWKISEIYLMLITSTLAVYYLPRLAEIKTSTDMKIEIIKVYRFVLPVVITGSLIIYLLRDFIIQILFTKDFYPMRELFLWQLFGDVMKIGSWILAYIMVGRAMVKVYIITEVTFSISLVFLSWLMVNQFGLTGVPIAYTLNYCLYWITMAHIVTREMKRIDTS